MQTNELINTFNENFISSCPCEIGQTIYAFEETAPETYLREEVSLEDMYAKREIVGFKINNNNDVIILTNPNFVEKETFLVSNIGKNIFFSEIETREKLINKARHLLI